MYNQEDLVLQIYCLGQFQVKAGDQPVNIPSRPAQSLFAYLALNAGRVHRREKLAGLLWPDSTDENARSYLRLGIWRIRKALDSAGAAWQNYLQIDEIDICFKQHPGTFLDAAFLAAQNQSETWTIPDLVERVQVYTGELLPGFYDEWIILDREHLKSVYDQKMKLLLEQLEAAQHWAEVLEWSERWIAKGHVPEPAYRALMVAHALQGNITSVNTVYQRCQKAFDEELGIPPSDELNDTFQQILQGNKPAKIQKPLPELLEISAAPPTPGPTPYKGLEYFDIADADLFFGRERLTAHLLAHLRGSRLLAVVGASGSGKSSIVRAGLAPALQLENLQVEIITPTAHPLQVLSRLPDRGQDEQRHVVVIDQFEEIFTLCEDERERKSFIDDLLTRQGARAVVIVLRADFYMQCGRYPALREALSSQQAYIGPMTAEELRSAIEVPARRGGWKIEPGLVDLILREVKGEPGALPLLSHALLETWKRRSGRWMTLKGYAEAGGVYAAIARTAEVVYNRHLTVEQQNISRSIFLRLAELSEDLTGTRRRALVSEFIADPSGDRQVEAVLNILAASRLITMSEYSVEIAHEALIREWPKLRQWLEEDRAGVRLHHQLAESARQWEELGRDAGELYRGARLAQAVELSGKNPGLLNPLEHDFLQAAVYDEQRLRLEKEQQQQRELEAAHQLAEEQTRSNRRLRIFAIGISLVFLVTLITAWVALNQRNHANRTTHLAHSRELSAAAINQLEYDPQLSILLALEAINESLEAQVPISFEMESALHQAVRASKQKLVLRGHTAGIYGSSFSKDGKIVVTASEDGTFMTWNAQTGERMLTFEGHSAQVLDAKVHQNGLWIASTSRDHTTRLWDLETRQELWSFYDKFSSAHMLDFSPDGRLIGIILWDGRIILLDTSSGEKVIEIESLDEVISMAFSPDGATIAVVDIAGVVELINPETGVKQEVIDFEMDFQSALAFSPDGKKLAVVANDIKLWNMEEGSLIWSITGQPGSGYTGVNFSPDGQFLVAAGYSQGAQVWEVDTSKLFMTLPGHSAATFSASFNPAGDQILTGSQDGTARIWDFSPDREVAFIHSLQGSGVPKGARRAVYSPDNRWLAAGEGDDGAIGIWNAGTADRIRTLRNEALSAAVVSVAFHPNGKTLVSSDIEGRIALWDLLSGEMLRQWQASDEIVSAVRFNHSGDRIVSLDNVSLFKFWNANTGEPVGNPMFSFRTITYIALSPEDNAILIPSHTGAQRYIDIQTGQLSRVYRGQIGGVTDAAFSHNGKMIAAANEYGSGNVLLWETDTTQKLHTLDHVTTSVVGLAFSPDDQQLATVSLDATLRLWDVNTGQQTLLLENVSTLRPSGIAFSRDGRTIAVTCEEGIHLYLVYLEDLIQLAHTRLSRSFTAEECLRYAIASDCTQEEVSVPAFEARVPDTDRRLACYLPDWGGINYSHFSRVPHDAMIDAAKQLDWQTIALEPFLVFEMSEGIQKLHRSGCDLIILSTFEDDAVAVPDDHPDQRYLFVEADNPNENWDNVWNTYYEVDQASFLAGYLSAAMTKTGKVGIFGGAPIPAVLSFMDGFARGIEAYNQYHMAAVELLGWQVGGEAGQGIFTNFGNPEVADKTSQTLIAQGADILFPVAGQENMIAASKAALTHEEVWVIGVDQDWAEDFPEFASITLTSVMKNLDRTVFLAMEAVNNGTFSGGLHFATLENGGVGLAPFHEFEDQIPDEIKTELEQLRQGIIAGKVKTR
jgi:WD40 repeat protein/basic membrane lipoprotein Med (substrate-binding protein (PBP1-ABC) superfamily)/DNA-binding SARP family transcriptional activator